MRHSRNPTSVAWLAAALLLSPLPTLAQQPRIHAIDPVHTRVMFTIDHAGFSKAIGTVSGSTGTLEFDAEDWSRSRVDVSVPMDRVDLGDAAWNAAALAPNLLDAQRHPQARFISESVRQTAPGHGEACGQLTLRGVTAPLCLEIVFNQARRHPLPPFRRTIGFSATGQLDRTDFGIDAWPGLIGKDVELRIEAEAVASRGTAREDEAETETPSTTESQP